jgi:sodium/hydrogen antiporter
MWLRSRHHDPAAPTDFLALALIALIYAGAESMAAWGFLAVFAAGVGLSRAEMTVMAATPHPDLSGSPQAPLETNASVPHRPAENLVAAQVNTDDL